MGRQVVVFPQLLVFLLNGIIKKATVVCVVKSLNPTLYVLVIRLHSGRFDLQGPNLLQ